VPRLPLRAPDHPAPHGFSQVGLERRREHRPRRRHQALGQPPEPLRHLLLAVAGAQEALDECAGRGGRQAGHRLAQHARHLPDRLLAEAGVQEQPCGARHLQILLTEDPLLRPGLGKACAAPDPQHQLFGDASSLLHLVRGVATAEQPLHLQQHEAVLGHRLRKLRLGEPLLYEMHQQPPPGVALVSLQVAKQSIRIEVHGRHPR